MIKRASSICGMGDALNQRAFLITYCKQKGIKTSDIALYTEKYWWMFSGLGFRQGVVRSDFKGLVAFRNFGFYDMQHTNNLNELDKSIAITAGIDYSFETCVPFSNFALPKVELPEKYITFNTGFGDLSGRPGNNEYICLKSWPKTYWVEFVKSIGVPCVQIGAGKSCEIIPGAINLVNKLTITESAEVIRKTLFHVDMEGGLPILAQHLLKRSVVLFGPTAIENQGRSFNLNIRCSECQPCYEWGSKSKKHLYELKSPLSCMARCMQEIKPEYVIEQIRIAGWLEKSPKIDKKYILEWNNEQQ